LIDLFINSKGSGEPEWVKKIRSKVYFEPLNNIIQSATIKK